MLRTAATMVVSRGRLLDRTLPAKVPAASLRGVRASPLVLELSWRGTNGSLSLSSPRC